MELYQTAIGLQPIHEPEGKSLHDHIHRHPLALLVLTLVLGQRPAVRRWSLRGGGLGRETVECSCSWQVQALGRAPGYPQHHYAQHSRVL